MSQSLRWLNAVSLIVGVLLSSTGLCDVDQRLVVGSFSTAARAEQYTAKLAEELGLVFEVLAANTRDGERYRVVTEPLNADALTLRRGQIEAAGLQVWRLQDSNSQPRHGPDERLAAPIQPPQPQQRNVINSVSPPVTADSVTNDSRIDNPADSSVAKDKTMISTPDFLAGHQLDIDLGLQNRGFLNEGLAGQDRWQPSISVEALFSTRWGDGRNRFVAEPFLRLDGEDEERTHADLRQFYWNWIGDNWDFSLGAKTIFWGVTEFAHLVDVINQTDLAENIDGEDKLGQPMAQLSLIRDWGMLDLFLLVGHRPRTFPGIDGRLRYLLPVRNGKPEYDSGASRWHVDGAIRYSNVFGPLSIGVHHFAGTERDPWFDVVSVGTRFELQPHYGLMNQTGLDAQFIAGDWVFKLEALSRAGSDDRYGAFAAGFERTLVGIMGSRVDLGLVAEYLFDERGNAASSTLFERDVAFGTRWQFNDLPDSQALLGLIWDTRTGEYILSLEASRRLGDTWQLQLEGRWFSGIHAPEPAQIMADLNDGERKSASLQRDDLVQLELVRYF